MRKYMENEEEPWAGLRRSLCRLVEESRMNRKKTIEEICDMPTLEAWKTTLRQLPKGRLSEPQYDTLVALCNCPFMAVEEVEEAIDLLRMVALHFKQRYEKRIGDQQQNATLNWLAATNVGRLEE